METRLAVEGAELAVRSWGNGPPVLLLPAGNGGADGWAALAEALADRFTVVAFDRRGHFRSTGRRAAPMSIARLGDDAAAVIEQICQAPAVVFGSSAGGAITLDLVARHPPWVRGAIIHEPPVLSVLPDAERWRSVAERVASLGVAGQIDDAYRLLNESIGVPSSPDDPPIAADRRPEWEYLFRYEWPQLFSHRPDPVALATIRDRLVMASGADSHDAFQARTGRVLAEQLGSRYVVFPGNHVAPAQRPLEIAAVLGPLLTGLSTR